ncbi:MAG: hypothetical protein R2791_20860 [Saprospiraceae bacterium]
MNIAISRFLTLLFLLGSSCWLRAQQELHFDNGCNFASDKTSGTYTLFDPTEEAEQIVDEILNLAGITGERPFTLQVATVENAQANEREGIRYLLYSNNFIQEFKKDAKTKWVAYFVFAHEIGHLIRGHRFSETDAKLRKRMELEADRFAAVVMARMRVSRNDALAAAQNLRTRINIKPAYYPDPAAREEAISIEYDKEWKKIVEADKGKAGGDKIYLAIDPASFNRWNLVGSASAVLTDEKVLVNFKIMPQYSGRTISIVLCSQNPNIRVNTTIGTGTVMASPGNKTVEWNYQMDNVPRAMASQPNQLRIYVYDLNNMPKARVSPETQKKAWILAGSGALVGLAGIFPYTKALAKHDDYAAHIDPQDVFYTSQNTSRESFYKKADNQYVGGQVMMFTGGALILTGIIWSAIEKGKAKKDLKNTICNVPPRWQIEPSWVAGNAPGVALRLRF